MTHSHSPATKIAITLGLAIALFLGSFFIASAQATHMSGEAYLQTVNAQRAQANAPAVAFNIAPQLVQRINDMGDPDFAALKAYNDAHPTAWMYNPTAISLEVRSATRVPGTETVDPELAAKSGAENSKQVENNLQNQKSCFLNFEFTRCIGNPLGLWAMNVFLSMGGSLVEFSGAIFDFAINHVIIDFKGTLNGNILELIKNGWTFFRDIANIMIIGIFVFIAISLILGLKEYGQKKLIARVLIIAVIMNFSLLFTQLIIDSSNFVAYSIYSQAFQTTTGFSVAAKVLAPLHITGLWDDKQMRATTAKMGTEGQALKALSFGFFGFIILAILAAVLLYGAFLILARAVIFVFLMLSAPLAYASYLAPHFEASEFGWTAWWKSLINNAAFAPLLMAFLTVSILIMGAASPKVTGDGTFGDFLSAPQAAVLANGWAVLFAYFLGTGLLFISFRMSSSLAGSISGIKVGQMAATMPAAFAGAQMLRGAGALARTTIGRNASKNVERINTQMSNARISGDFAKVEQLRKQKAVQEKRADSSFNLMNSAVGKAIAAKAGLKGAWAGKTGETVAGGGNATKKTEKAMKKAVEAEQTVRAMQLTDDDKKRIRDEAVKEIQANHENEKTTILKDETDAKRSLDQAHAEVAAANVPALAVQAEQKVTQNKIQRAPEVEKATKDYGAVKKEKETMEAGHKNIIEVMRKETEQLSGDKHDEQVRAIEVKKAEHEQAIKAVDQRITEAHEKVKTITAEIEQPRTILEDRKRKAAQNVADRTAEHAEKIKTRTRLESKTSVDLAREGKKLGEQRIQTAEGKIKEGIQTVVKNVSNGNHATEHVVQHHIDAKFKKKTGAESIAEALKNIKKNGGGEEAAH